VSDAAGLPSGHRSARHPATPGGQSPPHPAGFPDDSALDEDTLIDEADEASGTISASGRFARLSIRHKLLAMVLLPLAGVLPLLGVALLWWAGVAVDRLLITKVRSDLAVAHGYFERTLDEVGESVTAVAESQALVSALADTTTGQPDRVVMLLARQAQRAHLDFMLLLDADDRLLASDHAWSATDTERPLDPMAPATPVDGASIELMSPSQTAVLPAALRDRVPVPLLPTRNAVPTDRAVEDRAMVLLATHAVHDAEGHLVGRLRGGVLLNRNLGFIDHLNEIVYPEGSLPFTNLDAHGTATLFLDDVRISTNVRLFGDTPHAGDPQAERAIGTRVSAAVRDAVLGSGRTWLDRAFVVNRWYVSAYEPLADSAGQRVGMLYVGLLESPFTWLKWASLAAIGLLFFGTMIVASFVSLRWARAIFKPLERMERTVRRVQAGELSARVGTQARHDEIGRLAGHLDRLLDATAQHTERLQRWNAELDAKVAERTQALAEAQQQLVRSEKLATVGQLTASIAHEVNNPIAVMQGNLDLLRSLLDGRTAAHVKPELDLLDEQVARIRRVTTQLLQYARPAEFAGYVEAVDTTRLFEDCLALARHQIAHTGIEVVRHLKATRQPVINRGELQQVLVNLIVNALQAMPQGGELTLTSRDTPDDGVELTVADTGGGIPPDLLPRLFEPFVTRRANGTGLGLWISRTLVERYGGDLTAANGGHGAVFCVRLSSAGPDSLPNAPAATARRGNVAS